ncbi:MAG: ATP-binding protein [Bacteroidales bacterium]|nr:ATP-binding protein [Bacteroidales bacterium]
MAFPEKIKEILTTWENDIINTKTFPREIYPVLEESMTDQLPVVLCGVRRCGKTYLMYMLFKEFEQGCYINFEDERLMGLTASDLEEIYMAYIGMKSPKRPLMFLDEVQNVEGWEKFVSRLYAKVKFVISGSNATLLSSEYATALTGRHIPYQVFPLSFSEYLKATGNHTLNRLITEQRAKLSDLLNDYFDYGGFPQASLEKNIELIKSTFNSILFRDIIRRFGVKNALSLETLARYLAVNPGKLFSYRRLSSLVNISHEDTVKNYISYMEKAYLFSTVLKFDYSIRKQYANQKKIYTVDTSFSKYAGHLFSDETGRLLETVVFNELKRRGFDVYYWRNEQGKEVDFVSCRQLVPVQLIQVSVRITDEQQLAREISPLLIASEILNIKNILLITLYPVTFNLPSVVAHISAIDWLLSE